MGPGFFVIAIMGCADGGVSCTPVATLPTRYESAAECSIATAPALEASTSFDFPTLVARCRSGAVPAAASDKPEPVSSDLRRG